jgi:hypothetical protein
MGAIVTPLVTLRWFESVLAQCHLQLKLKFQIQEFNLR